MADGNQEPAEAQVAEICDKHGIGGEDVFLVRALLGRKKSGWPGCCGAGCSPCMEDVTAAAEEILSLTR